MSAPLNNKYAIGNQGGRPRAIKPDELENFGYEMVTWAELKTQEILDETEVSKKMPFFLYTFCREHNVSEDTITRYSKENKEFCGAVERVKGMIKEMLILGGLKGWWNPSAFVFVAKNTTDMRDKTETDVTSGGEKLSVNVLSFDEYRNNTPQS